MFETSPNGDINLGQFDAGLRKLGGAGFEDLEEAHMQEIFDEFDSDGSGTISVLEWKSRCNAIRSESGVSPFEDDAQAAQPEADTPAAAEGQAGTANRKMRQYGAGARKDTHQLGDAYDLSNWGMLYCGGALPIIRALNSVSKKLHIDLKVESFDW